MDVTLKDYCHNYTDGNEEYKDCGNCHFLGGMVKGQYDPYACRIYVMLRDGLVYG